MKRSKILDIFIVLIALGTFGLLFLPAVTYTTLIGATDYTGLNLAIGYALEVPFVGEFAVFKLSLLNLAAWGLVFLVFLLTLICLCCHKNKKVLAFITFILALGAVAMFFFTKNFVALGDWWERTYSIANMSFATDEAATLAYGTYVAMGAMGLCAILSFWKLFMRK